MKTMSLELVKVTGAVMVVFTGKTPVMMLPGAFSCAFLNFHYDSALSHATRARVLVSEAAQARKDLRRSFTLGGGLRWRKMEMEGA